MSEDCPGEPPGELTMSATAFTPLSEKAASSGPATAARLSPPRKGCDGPMMPASRTTATTGFGSQPGRMRLRTIGGRKGAMRFFMTSQIGMRRGCGKRDRIPAAAAPLPLALLPALAQPAQLRHVANGAACRAGGHGGIGLKRRRDAALAHILRHPAVLLGLFAPSCQNIIRDREVDLAGRNVDLDEIARLDKTHSAPLPPLPPH